MKRIRLFIASVRETLVKLMRPSREQGRTGAFMVVVIAAAAMLVALFFVWSRMQLVQIGYEISRLEKTNKVLKKRERELMLETASLKSPVELERKARQKAGLVFPSIEKVVHVP